MADPIAYQPDDPGCALLDRLLESGRGAIDGLRPTELPFVPGVRLHLASDTVVLEARLQAERGHRLPPPLWADVWAGGQALARHIVDHPELVAGRTVLDVASGSGVVAITAAVAGAGRVMANDVNPYALAAIALNARSNGVAVAVRPGDVLDGDGEGADVVLAGDVFYSEPMAARVLAFLERAAARGARVLVGDPGRACLPRERFAVVATYPLSMTGAGQDAQVGHAFVLQLRPRCRSPVPGVGYPAFRYGGWACYGLPVAVLVTAYLSAPDGHMIRLARLVVLGPVRMKAINAATRRARGVCGAQPSEEKTWLSVR